MKRLIFGLSLVFIGLSYSLTCFVHALDAPWFSHGADGLLGSFLGTNTLFPFFLSILIMTCGLLVCLFEAYRRK